MRLPINPENTRERNRLPPIPPPSMLRKRKRERACSDLAPQKKSSKNNKTYPLPLKATTAPGHKKQGEGSQGRSNKRRQPPVKTSSNDAPERRPCALRCNVEPVPSSTEATSDQINRPKSQAVCLVHSTHRHSHRESARRTPATRRNAAISHLSAVPRVHGGYVGQGQQPSPRPLFDLNPPQVAKSVQPQQQ